MASQQQHLKHYPRDGRDLGALGGPYELVSMYQQDYIFLWVPQAISEKRLCVCLLAVHVKTNEKGPSDNATSITFEPGTG